MLCKVESASVWTVGETGRKRPHGNACKTNVTATSFALTLQWIPTHSGVAGNDEANALVAASHNDHGRKPVNDSFP